jgi:hypothetical protein
VGDDDDEGVGVDVGGDVGEVDDVGSSGGVVAIVRAVVLSGMS